MPIKELEDKEQGYRDKLQEELYGKDSPEQIIETLYNDGFNEGDIFAYIKQNTYLHDQFVQHNKSSKQLHTFIAITISDIRSVRGREMKLVNEGEVRGDASHKFENIMRKSIEQGRMDWAMSAIMRSAECKGIKLSSVPTRKATIEDVGELTQQAIELNELARARMKKGKQGLADATVII